jgi:hypothetical protein
MKHIHTVVRIAAHSRIVVVFMLVVTTLVLVPSAPVQAQATTFTTNTIIPFFAAFFVPCAANGLGEVIVLSGDVHMLVHGTLDANGGFHSRSLDNPQGITGIGLTTGDTYRGTGVTEAEFNGKVGAESTFVNNFHIIGQGQASNLLLHTNIHGTLTPNGDVTAFFDHTSVECR